jgi:membrane-associated phospholipid phosphatase
VKRLRVLLQIWLLSLLACAAVVAVSFAHVDVPLAVRFWDVGRFLRPLNSSLGSAVILSLESTVTVALIFARLLRGRISKFGETLAIACLASICAYGINDQVLKPVFGVPTPAEVIGGANHAFHLFAGTQNSSFPSGHMVLAGAFAGVFMRRYRQSILVLAVLLVAAAALLIVGDWHFLSDAIAGMFVGVSAGVIAGEAWTVHSAVPPQ